MCRRVFLLTVALLGLASAVAHASTPHDLTGTWSCCGSGGAGAQVWTITAMDKASGSFSGTGAGGSIRMTITGTATGDSVSLLTDYDGSSYDATFTGTLSADSRSFAGSWTSNAGQRGTFTATRPDAPAPREPGEPGDPGRAPSTSDPRAPPAAADPGELYVTDSGAPGGSALYRVDARTGVKELVHSGAPFASVRGLGFGPDGDLYVADFGASAIFKLVLATGAVTRVSQGSTLLYRPWDVAFSALWPQDVLVTESFLKSVVRVNRASGKVEHLVDPMPSGFGLRAPHGIAATLFGDPFVADFDTHWIHRVELFRGNWTATVQKSGFLSALQDLAIGVGVSGGQAFPRFFASGVSSSSGAPAVYTWLERDPELAPSGSGTPELLASGGVLRSLTGIALSNDGRTVYVASVDAVGGGSIVAIDLATRRVRTLADGFRSPIGIAVAPPREVAVSVGGGGRAGSGTTARPTGVTTTVVAGGQPLALAAGVVVGGLPRAHVARSVRVRAVRRVVAAGRRARVVVRFPRALARQIRAALSGGARVTARLTVTAAAAGGERTRVVKRVRIR